MTSLYISRFYFVLSNLVAIIVCCLLGCSLGLRFWRLGLFLALFQFPAAIFFGLIFISILNPKIEEHYPNYFDLKKHF